MSLRNKSNSYFAVLFSSQDEIEMSCVAFTGGEWGGEFHNNSLDEGVGGGGDPRSTRSVNILTGFLLLSSGSVAVSSNL